MGSKRTVILLAALVIGAVAAFSLYSYVNGVENRAYSKSEPVPVYVVAETIPAGTSGQQALAAKALVVKAIPREFMPATAVTDPSTINAKYAKTDLVQGQVIVADMFVDKQKVAASTWSAQIGSSDMVAIEVQLDQVKGMSGILQPGDKVTMMIDLSGDETAPVPGQAGKATGASEANKQVRFLYSNVEVMGIGGAGVSVAGDKAAPATGPIMFRVPLRAAEKIALVGTKIYLALEPDGFVPTETDMAPMDWSKVFEGEKTPYKTVQGSAGATTTSTTVKG